MVKWINIFKTLRNQKSTIEVLHRFCRILKFVNYFLPWFIFTQSIIICFLRIVKIKERILHSIFNAPNYNGKDVIIFCIFIKLFAIVNKINIIYVFNNIFFNNIDLIDLFFNSFKINKTIDFRSNLINLTILPKQLISHT